MQLDSAEPCTQTGWHITRQHYCKPLCALYPNLVIGASSYTVRWYMMYCVGKGQGGIYSTECRVESFKYNTVEIRLFNPKATHTNTFISLVDFSVSLLVSTRWYHITLPSVPYHCSSLHHLPVAVTPAINEQ